MAAERSCTGASRRTEQPRLPSGALVSPRDGGVQVSEIQRSRLLVAAVSVVAEFGCEGGSVARITERARVSRRTFYELFDNREECLLAVLDRAVQRITAEINGATLEGRSWHERVRGGLWTILSFFDREPELARVCIVEIQRASQLVLVRRQEIIDQLAKIADEGRGGQKRQSDPVALTGEGVAGAVFHIVYVRLLDGTQKQPLRDLLGELMAMIVLPYMGSAAARREQERSLPAPILTDARDGVPATPASFEELARIPMRLTYRTARALQEVGDHPGASNRQVGERVGIADQGQISKLLARLERLGLLTNATGDAVAKGEANQWSLTTTGVQVVRTIRSHVPQTRSRQMA